MEKLIEFLPKLSLWGFLWGGTSGLISWIISSPLLHGLIGYGPGAFIGQLLGAFSIAIFCKLLFNKKISWLIFALIITIVFSFVWDSKLTIEVKQAIESYYSTKTDYNYALSYILCFGFIAFFVGFALESYLKFKTYLSGPDNAVSRNPEGSNR